MVCQFCGQSVPDESRFCLKCGKEIPIEQENTSVQPLVEQVEVSDEEYDNAYKDKVDELVKERDRKKVIEIESKESANNDYKIVNILVAAIVLSLPGMFLFKIKIMDSFIISIICWLIVMFIGAAIISAFQESARESEVIAKEAKNEYQIISGQICFFENVGILLKLAKLPINTHVKYWFTSDDCLSGFATLGDNYKAFGLIDIHIGKVFLRSWSIITQTEVGQDTESIVVIPAEKGGSGVKRALVGGVLAGGAGAVVGALTAKLGTPEVRRDFVTGTWLKLYTIDERFPGIKIRLPSLDEAKALQGLIHRMIERFPE